MRKFILFLTILFQITILFGQSSNWGPWTINSCYHGISFRCKVEDYNSSAKKWKWTYEFKNSYSSKVSFTWKFTTNSMGGRTSIQSNSTDNSWCLDASNQGLYFDVTSVCFDPNDYCSTNSNGKQNKGYKCYAECDNGIPNVPALCGNLGDNTNQNSTTITNTTTTQQQNDPTFDRNNASFQDYYKTATAEGQAGNYDEAVNLWNSAISVAVNDAQRDNARAWLAEAEKAKANKTNNDNLQKQQESQRQNQIVQEQRKQQQFQKGLNEISDGISGIAAIIKENKETKKQEDEEIRLRRQRQKDYDEREAQKKQQTYTNALNGDYKAQAEVAHEYFRKGEFQMAKQYYKSSMNGSGKFNRYDLAAHYITTLAILGEKDKIFEFLTEMKSVGMIRQFGFYNRAMFNLFSDEFMGEYFVIDKTSEIEGIKIIKEELLYKNEFKAIYAFMQVTGDYENYGIPKEEEIGLKFLNKSFSKEKYVSDDDKVSLYFLGMIYLKGTTTIEKDEKKALKYFLKVYNKEEKELKNTPEYDWYPPHTYFNNELLSYLKIAEIYSDKKNKTDHELGILMLENFYRNFKYLIPKSDLKYFSQYK